MFPGYVPPVREMTGTRVAEQDDDDGGAAAFQQAEQDPEGLNLGRRLQRPPNHGASVLAVI